MSRLKELLARRRAKEQTDTQPTAEVRTEADSPAESTSLVLVPAFDTPLEDEYSPYF